MALFGSSGRLDALTARVAVLEQQVAELARRLEIQPAEWQNLPVAAGTAELSSEVVRYLRAGQQIQAVRQYRSETGAGLKESITVIQEYLAGGHL